ncbi:uncharacterized protein IL334_007436 [Kwoniella shivajii]|uniref:U3 small nucleolar RNA-associated protein 22 n=1 Tax=Kwoniella shivajii TaxID=564305 RepID=A0ABZ1D9G3_9TREE|nr:hypothetical protein IL334_007436 [Kwoniella shivajii]
MSALKSLKRKASTSKDGQKKRTPAQRPSPSPSDAGFEDLETGENVESADTQDGLYDDPMIDRQASDESEDEEDGTVQSSGIIETENTPAAGPSRRQPSKNLYKAPTIEEMEKLRSVEQSGGTSFTLQLSALLESTLLSTTPHPSLKGLLSTIHSSIIGLPSLPGLSPLKAIKRIGDGVKIPFPGGDQWEPTKENVKWTLGWEKPEEIIIGGSWGVVGGYKKGKGEAGEVDLVVIMPSNLFSLKDRMDYRYFHKRAHYLSVIYAALQKSAKQAGPLNGVTLSWDSSMGDVRRPVIVVTAGKEQGLKHRLHIRIHAGISPALFPPSNLSPSKSLLRNDVPTPLYSSSILNDASHKSYLLHLHRLSQVLKPERTVDSYLAIWRIWATRRGIKRERGGSGWFASMILGWVVEGGEIGGASGVRENTKKVRGVGKGLGHWGAIRAAWEFLAHTNFSETPVFTNTVSDDTLPHSDFTKSFEDILVDPTGRFNVFAGWEKGEIQLLRHHARETLAMLEDENTDKFGETFLRNRKVGVEVFDESIKVDISLDNLRSLENSEHPSTIDMAAHAFAGILRQGLSDRAKLVYISPSSSSTLDIGIIYNPEHATRVIDIGPSSNSSQALKAEEFRQLWGEKAELRRFKDGSIAESVVWDLSRPEEATLIPGKIVRYLLRKHFAISEEQVHCLSSNVDWQSVTQIPVSARNATSLAGSEKQGFRPTLSAYDELYKLLKDIDSELPLAILNVTPASEMLRYSSTFVPHPIDVNRLPSSPTCINYVPYADVVVQFESSPKWPDDLSAIQKVKLALFEKLAKVIESRIPASKLTVVFDEGSSEIEDHASLDILLPQGVAFRLRIYHERERTLLQRVVYEDEPVFATSLPRPPRKLASPALEKHIRLFSYSTQHHSSITPLHHKYPSYSSASRLLKRWFASHMLSTHISAEIVELIMAKVYLDPGSLQTPASATAGFVRAITLLAEWDWKSEALFVPIFSVKEAATSSTEGRVKFPIEKRSEALKAFDSLRSKDKSEGANHGWVVITEEDEAGLRWTRGITKVIAGRVGTLAKATLMVVKRSSETGELDVKSLFITPLEQYDFLLYLTPSTLSKYSQSVTANSEEWEAKLKFRNLQASSSNDIRIGFDPAERYVEDLKRIYGDAVLLFWDKYGGRAIGGIWNPSKEASRSLKAFLGWNSNPVESDSALITINKDAILAEMVRLGRGLVEKVERRR